jgi:E3 ubiquitin-protein ligase BIG BROTHER-like protein
MEVHYINTGFPYTTTESFMDFFEGLTHAPVNYAHTGPMHDQVFIAFNAVFMFEKK